MKLFIKCIKKFGFINTLWFYFYLRRDEFSNKLSYYNYYRNKKLDKLCKDRLLAHNIELYYSSKGDNETRMEEDC